MHIIKVCGHRHCRARHSVALLSIGQTLDSERFQLEISDCLSHCDYGPNVWIDGVIHTEMTPKKLQALVDHLEPKPEL